MSSWDNEIKIAAQVADQLERDEEVRMEQISRIADAISFKENLEEKLGLDFVSDFEYGLARVRKGKLWGLIDESGSVILPIEYDEIWKFEGKHRVTTKAILNGEEMELYLCDYSELAPLPTWKRYRINRDIDAEDNYYDDFDTRSESWYAMTDGQYGDMPDGFDGDYSFLGY